MAKVLTLNDDGTIVWAEAPTAVLEDGGETPFEFANASHQLRLRTRGGVPVPSTALVQALRVDRAVWLNARFTLTRGWKDAELEDDVPDGEWQLFFGPPIWDAAVEVRPSRAFNTYDLVVGALALERGYHQRGLSGGIVAFEHNVEGDDASPLVLVPRWGAQDHNVDNNNRLSISYPFKWERGSWFRFSIGPYEAVEVS